MSNSVSITRISLDPELLSELFEKLPRGVFEQLTHNRGTQTEALVRNEKENRLLPELLCLMRVRKYGPASEFGTVCGSLTRDRERSRLASPRRFACVGRVRDLQADPVARKRHIRERGRLGGATIAGRDRHKRTQRS
jgi:hypothetical protein